MDVDSASSSPSSRLSVVCSASAEYSSNSSEGSSPNSRRNSVNESVIKDEHYWERRRRNNDASRRSREKRRLNDLAMEEKILQLSAENERLKTELETRGKVDEAKRPSQSSQSSSSTSTTTMTAATTTSVIIPDVAKNLFPASLQASSMLSVPLLQTAPHFSMLHQLCQLQPSPIYPAPSASSSTSTPSSSTASSLFSSTTSAFQPFRPAAESSVIMRIVERQSPDSSTDKQPPSQQLQAGTNVIQRVGSPTIQLFQQNQQAVSNQQQGPSLLSALLAQRRPSPTVPQSRTERISGLTSPPRNGSSKSDCESVSSSASLSPSHSSEDHSNKSPQYVDRRRRNNEAAKRCRANRRAVFEYRSRRVQLLEGENDDLRTQIDSLKAEIAHCKTILAQRAAAAAAVNESLLR